MITSNTEKLLKDERVIAEINKHKWFESEKAGYDIGFERAARDWLNRYADSWMRKNMPEKKYAAEAETVSATFRPKPGETTARPQKKK